MHGLVALALMLTGPSPEGKVFWSPNIKFALALASRNHKPVLAAGLGTMRGAAFLYDDTYAEILKQVVPVVVPTYEELRVAAPSLPKRGTPSIVLLDSNGRLLKRIAGMSTAVSDLQVALSQAEWLSTKGDVCLRDAARAEADGNVHADAATALAMRSDAATAIQHLAMADTLHATSAKVVRAWEAMGDDSRVSGDNDSFRRCARYYRAALTAGPDVTSEARIRLHYAIVLYRLGDPDSAIEQTRIILADPAFSPEDMQRARVLQSRIIG